MEQIKQCDICPRFCPVDRQVRPGYCGALALPQVARAALHHWEEPPISGSRGSGAVFFSGCNLRCVFCQNFDISATTKGKICDEKALCSLFLNLQAQGAHNINLVTPTPHTPVLIEALRLAKEKGLDLPILWNTNGYERVETLCSLEGLVDLYLPDLKYVSSALSQKYSGAADYFSVASKAIEEMWRQCGPLQLNAEGIAQRGVIVRHLVLPGSIDEARRVIDHLYSAYGSRVTLSLMRQYTPMHRALTEPEKFPFLARRVTTREYNRAVDYALAKGMTQLFIQKSGAAAADFTPAFDGTGVE